MSQETSTQLWSISPVWELPLGPKSSLLDKVWAYATTRSNTPMSHYFLTRIVFLRALALVYFVAFLVAFHQNKALIGDDGITPARYLLQEAQERAKQIRQRREQWLETMFGNNNNNDRDAGRRIPQQFSAKQFLLRQLLPLRRSAFYQRTREVLWDRADRRGRPMISLFWLTKDFQKLNPWLDRVAMTGMLVSLFVAIVGAANFPLLATLWLCQRSLMAVGGCFYGYGWEPQLAELGFHALFLVPFWSLNPIANSPPSRIVIYAIRWYLFRIMLGAGLIKLRSRDKKWKDLTTMNYFYETQPVPNILTRRMHFMPQAWHKFEVLTNHFVELIAPWFLLLPYRQFVKWGGILQLQFQLTLILTGNLSFLNWLTMVPALVCFDDACLRRFFDAITQMEAAIAAATYHATKLRTVVSLGFGLLVAFLSIPVVQNLLSRRQRMNSSFDRLRLINSYGAFGTVDEVREEWIIQSATEMDDNSKAEWREYEFKVKPGNVHRRPRWITPYHYRLDWQMWIARACRSLDRSPWIFRFLYKLLQGDKGVLNLLEKDPWEGEAQGPKYIKVDAYRYRFHKATKGGANEENPYWEREFVGRIYPRQGVATLESLKREIETLEPRRPI